MSATGRDADAVEHAVSRITGDPAQPDALFSTTLGIVIGVGAVITMVTLGNGATRSVSDQISSMGSNPSLTVPHRASRPSRPYKARLDEVESQLSLHEVLDQVTVAKWSW